MGDHIKLSIKSPNCIPKTTVDREHISVNVVTLCASKRKQCLLFKLKWCESNVLVNFVCSYFVSRSFTKLLLCSQIKAPFGLTPSSEDCGPKPKLKGQRLGTVWLLGIIRIEEQKKMVPNDLSTEEGNLRAHCLVAPHPLLLWALSRGIHEV